MSARKHGITDSTVQLADMGMRLKARRIELGMSQQQLADYLGVSFQQVQKYEKGTNSISSVMLQTIASALDITPLYFLDDNATLKADAALLASSPNVKRLVCGYNKIENPRIKAHLVALVEQLTGNNVCETKT